MMKKADLRAFLDRKVKEYEQAAFISRDPITIPHQFSKKADIEIAAFFAAIFAWGNRTTIINKSMELMDLMDRSPHEFITQHSEQQLQRMLAFRHRTFNVTDLLYFILFLKHHYQRSPTLETAFTNYLAAGAPDITEALNGFHHYFFSLEDAPARTRKHIAMPSRNSTCKRLNMFLRWMVRPAKGRVDFGIWKKISPAQLICPMDVHVARVAMRFQLIQRKQVDWLSALELTSVLKKFDRDDPVKYDFALFGLGAEERF